MKGGVHHQKVAKKNKTKKLTRSKALFFQCDTIKVSRCQMLTTRLPVLMVIFGYFFFYILSQRVHQKQFHPRGPFSSQLLLATQCSRSALL